MNNEKVENHCNKVTSADCSYYNEANKTHYIISKEETREHIERNRKLYKGSLEAHKTY